MHYNCLECSQFVLIGVVMQCALLKIWKKGDFSYKFSFWLKQGVGFFQWKGVSNTVTNIITDIVTIKPRSWMAGWKYDTMNWLYIMEKNFYYVYILLDMLFVPGWIRGTTSGRGPIKHWQSIHHVLSIYVVDFAWLNIKLRVIFSNLHCTYT